MHNNEFVLSVELVSRLIKSQCPQWSALPLELLSEQGTAHVLFQLGKQYVVRLPRIPGLNSTLKKEYTWVPRLAHAIKTQVSFSEPIFLGTSTTYYPSVWMVSLWQEGSTPTFENEQEYDLLAQDMAKFLNELHQVDLAKGPKSRRGVPLHRMD